MIDVLAPLALIVIGAAYAKRSATLRGQDRPVATWRQVSFAAGLFLLIAADLPPLANLAEELVVAHMVQHLVIADLAALLVVLGLTGPLLQPILALRGLRWLRVFGNPLVALPVWALNLYLWHLSVLYEGVLDSAPLHLLQHAAFFSSASRCGCRSSDRCRSPPGSATRRWRFTWSSSASRGRRSPTCSCGRGSAALRRVRGGGGAAPDFAAYGPGRGGDGDDGRAGR